MSVATHGITRAIALRPDVSVRRISSGDVEFSRAGAAFVLHGVSVAVYEAILQLMARWSSPDDLADDIVRAGSDATEVAGLFYVLDAIEARGCMRCGPAVDDRLLFMVETMTQRRTIREGEISASTSYQLSRFAYCRLYAGEFILESPLSPVRVVLVDPAVSLLVASLARPSTPDQLGRRLDAEECIVEAILAELVAWGFANSCEDGETRESTALRQWEFHDLMFHTRSRRGTHDYAVGAHMRFRGEIEPLPAVRPIAGRAVIALDNARAAALVQGDALQEIMERRSSIRTYGQPLTLDQLSVFLYRTARVKSVRERDDSLGRYYEESNRPYPSGGAAYDLEIYLTVRRCHDLAAGIYHYDPLGHQLSLVNDDAGAIEHLVRDALISSGGTVTPDILVTFTSRFQRLSWKYDAIAYATTLKNVGVLFQTMYLVATSMSLAPCALGSGNSAFSAVAFGLDPLTEGAVGEFMIGTAADAAR